MVFFRSAIGAAGAARFSITVFHLEYISEINSSILEILGSMGKTFFLVTDLVGFFFLAGHVVGFSVDSSCGSSS